MLNLETAWTVLFDAFGMIPRGPEGLAVVLSLLCLSFLITQAAVRLALWLPRGIGMLLLFLWEVFEALLRRLFWRAEEKSEKKPRKRNVVFDVVVAAGEHTAP
jgi:hypothetical protein